MRSLNIEFDNLEVNGIRLHTALIGPPKGNPVILLHGFPEAWFGWENQIEPLVKAGLRVIIPDQRGYNLSSKPTGIDEYLTETLINDILGLADKLGYKDFYLAGHDWGAIIAWGVALSAPERVKRLVIANVPHPAVFKTFLKSHLSQMLKSWYMIFFQIPRIPEWFSRLGNWKFLVRAMPGYWEEDQYNRYREAWSQPGAITTMINWYRAAFSRSSPSRQSNIIQPPTLIIWGKQDPHLSCQMAALSLEYCPEGELVYFDDASHWVQHDKAPEVSQLLIDHFQKD
jgi:pimeloyl-ACP methyl ester carboxylesterase